MPAIQQTSSTSVFNLLTTEKTITQKSLPIIAVKPSVATHLSPTVASGISDQQGASTRTISTETFLTKLKRTAQQGMTTDYSAATTLSSMLSAAPSSIRKTESVTTKAGVATSNESFTLSEHINLPTKQTQSEKYIGTCLTDQYVQNHNGTTTHNLRNTCKNTTFINGYVDLECSVSPPSNNPFSVFTLNKQGDLYTVETYTDNCEQAIKSVHPDNLPIKVGDCLYDIRTMYNDRRIFEDKVINTCKDSVAYGYVDANCQLGFNASNPSAGFTLNPREALTIETNYFCNKAVYEGKAPPIKIGNCFHDFITANNNGTTTHKIINICFSITEYGYMRKGCRVSPSPNNEWNHFGLSQNAEISFLVQDKKGCEKPIRSGNPPITSYEKIYCPSKNASSVDLPKAEKIVAGENLLSQDARHLVYIENKDISVCTGSLISARHVLTAAHCVKESRISKQSAFLENLRVDHDPYPRLKETQYIPTVKYKVKAGHLAPCYVQHAQQENCDLALLELEKPVVNAQMLSLPTEQDFCEFAKEVDKVLATDVAFPYDLAEQYDETQSVWQEGNVLAQGFGKEKDAEGNMVHADRAKQGKLVAFKIAGKKDGVISTRSNTNGDNICYGDSGGPLVYKTKDEKKVQLGVICCFYGDSQQCTQNAFYTNLQKHRTWLEERMAEDPKSVKVKLGDLTRLRVSPNLCVEKSDVPDGFLSWFGGFTFSIQGRRRITLTNHCHNENHPAKVNVKFYSTQGKGQKQEPTYGIEKVENVAQLDVGETRVFHTDGTEVKTVLTWSDLDK